MAATAADIPLQISSDNSSSERRISPAWSISQFKARLEPITGVPASCQRLSLKLASQRPLPIEAADEDATLLARWPLQAYAEVVVTDTRPPGLRPNYTDVSAVPKYELPPDAYEARTDSVLAWKKANHLGRFDPAAPSIEEQKAAASYREVAERHITLNARCRLLPDSDSRRGTVRFVGDVDEIPGVGAWIGVELDEPTGKNDGSVKGTRYFECRGNCGVFVRPERVEVGEFEVLDELGEDEEF
ncbi:CAP Gly-rich domain-containing protein [Neohortaea acidophila]|uniref:CAP Gly-rich domain-containing protein n=1 Tax=Neohortaea acidophila TaxID=245834 RepID=A0A6A6PGB0_9PEZI|nr:CAP Gly-rich domain-containing protein [Neohortaea acidophila]KAF2478816.1 CAP Gly-rich domain-containing protein [Neohortaea acidophila]